MMWALVPVKEPAQSKQRISGVLAPVEREGLVVAMLRDVLTAIRGADLFDGILVVSRAPQIAVLAREFDTAVFAESAGSDHSRAVTEANRYLVSQFGAQSSLAISGDVPRVTPCDIRQVIAARRSVTLVPNDGGEGTNAILNTPPNAIPFQFGGRSLERHVASSKAAGLSLSVVRNANIALDMDEPQDLVRAVRELSPSHTRDYLDSSGIAARVIRQPVFQLTERLRTPAAIDQ